MDVKIIHDICNICPEFEICNKQYCKKLVTLRFTMDAIMNVINDTMESVLHCISESEISTSDKILCSQTVITLTSTIVSKLEASDYPMFFMGRITETVSPSYRVPRKTGFKGSNGPTAPRLGLKGSNGPTGDPGVRDYFGVCEGCQKTANQKCMYKEICVMCPKFEYSRMLLTHAIDIIEGVCFRYGEESLIKLNNNNICCNEPQPQPDVKRRHITTLDIVRAYSEAVTLELRRKSEGYSSIVNSDRIKEFISRVGIDPI